ncbi:Hypothetical predicted protein [Lynx pardinus]|uniref:Uncharacterized protein n=1 Tax=Lynx pardinus TaxID=191816 RepID=A0A485N202_LYNPA|nr:Hypothetical predicted protein [Lynx pardinus]
MNAIFGNFWGPKDPQSQTAAGSIQRKGDAQPCSRLPPPAPVRSQRERAGTQSTVSGRANRDP